MGSAISTGPLVCGTGQRDLDWIAPSPGSVRGIVLERMAGLVVLRPRSDGTEIETTITSFRDFDLPRPL